MLRTNYMERIDKFLWCVRLFKTRSLAADACKKGHILMGGISAKASKMVQVGDEFQVKKMPVIFSYKILAIPPSRVGAKLVENHLQNITTPEQTALFETLKIDMQNNRARGAGRPTKKERRDLDEFFIN